MLGLLAGGLLGAASAWAGGSGLNTVVIVNQDSSNSLALGNYYCEQRQVPPQNVLRVTWTGSRVQWTAVNVTNVLLQPLATMLAARGLTNQVDYVVLSMDFPYRVNGAGLAPNSTTAMLYYGYQTDTNPPCSLASNSVSAYAGSESPFRTIAPGNSSGSFLATMITASNLTQAMQIVDQGVAGDSTFPAQTAWLAKSSDSTRNVRFAAFDSAVFDARLRGNYSLQRVNTDAIPGPAMLLGLQTGLSTFSIGTNVFVPGAMADSLTSYGGMLFETSGQTSLLAFLAAGAAGSYGTVTEPCNYPDKFPSPENYFYQARGFTLAECYYLSVTNPYQGLIVGEPLSAPFALPASGGWSNLTSGALLTGVTNLTARFAAADATHPLAQVDLFLDGVYRQTLTNVTPQAGNALDVTLPGKSISYTVPAAATVQSIASDLAGMLNSPLNQLFTKVSADTHGDRLTLRSTDSTRDGSQTVLSVNNRSGTASALTTFAVPARPDFLNTMAWGTRSYTVAGGLVVGDTLQLDVTKTNGTVISVAVTNTSGDSVYGFVLQLLAAVNARTELRADDGLVAEDWQTDSTNTAYFNLRARSPGWAAAQIQAQLSGTFTIQPVQQMALDENLTDLQPRNHLYVTAGVTNLAVTFPLDTTTLADGYHELTAVAYEGSSVRTQTRSTQSVRIQNHAWSATLQCDSCATNTSPESTLQFTVTAGTGAVTRIELYGTGGLLAASTNESVSTFAVPGSGLGAGLHPFYAVVTAAAGEQYRTATQWVRLTDAAPPFMVSIAAPPVTLTWPAVIGRSYDILGAASLTDAFQIQATVVASNTLESWTETNAVTPPRFYRLQVTP